MDLIVSTDDMLSPDSSATFNIFGDPELFPRIGDEFQVEITKSNYILCDAVNKSKSVLPCDFLIGLPIPIMWVTNNPDYKFEAVKEDCLVPGTGCDSWTKIEKDSFVLGLYIFEKNFVQVRRFVECKKMEVILAFYYGKFYRSNEYKKWSACRKSRSKKYCVYGQRMFIGQRQQELLSRILPHVSDECRNVLVEISKTFSDGKVSLEEYVSTLKSMVGMNKLVEVVGIGKGKQDLTSLAFESSKSTHILTSRPEIPIGKACSSLTPDQITKFLTGDFRLSKARSRDLFWEAVWPLLLAQGWHSEEPAGGSKKSLVFVVPGVNKFSRRRLLKGTHYFDSVTDVLSKVASEPELLHVGKNVTEWEQDGMVEPWRHCYLQPRTPFCSADIMELTTVDTSLPRGETCKVRELTSLPVEICESTSSEDSDMDGIDVSTGESGCVTVNAVLLDQNVEMNGPDSSDSNLKRSHLDCSSSSPVKRHRKLSACGDADTDKKETNGLFSDATELSQTRSSDDKFSCSGSSRTSPIVPLFDLNFPPLPQVDEDYYDFVNENETFKAYSASPEQNGKYRRQSTRKRPPTARALEALANGLLTTKSRRKSKYTTGF